MIDLKKGDKVIAARKYLDYPGGWVQPMTKDLGKEFIIKSVTDSGSYKYVMLEEHSCSWPIETFDLVSPSSSVADVSLDGLKTKILTIHK